MTAQPLESYLDDEFLVKVLAELKTLGFVSDEHEFAPYRETISVHRAEIERALRSHGFRGDLQSGYINHPLAGYAYYIYDAAKLKSGGAADQAVGEWLTKRYGG